MVSSCSLLKIANAVIHVKPTLDLDLIYELLKGFNGLDTFNYWFENSKRKYSELRLCTSYYLRIPVILSY